MSSAEFTDWVALYGLEDEERRQQAAAQAAVPAEGE